MFIQSGAEIQIYSSNHNSCQNEHLTRKNRNQYRNGRQSCRSLHLL